MFSKITIVLTLALSLAASNQVFAQAKKPAAKKVTTKRAAKAEVAKKDNASEARALEDAKLAEAKAAAEKLKAEEAKAAAEKAKTQTVVDSSALGIFHKYVTLNYHGEYYFVRRDITSANEDDHDIQDLSIMHNPSIIIKPFKNWKFSASSEFKYSDAIPLPATFRNRHQRSLFTLTHENLLTQAENGVKLDMAIARRLNDRIAAPTNYGNTRFNVKLSKKFNDKLDTNIVIQYLYNDPYKISAATWKHGFNLLPYVSYQITDKLSYLFTDDFIIYTPRYSNTKNDIMISHDMNLAYLTYQFTGSQSAYFQFKYLREPTFAASANDYFSYYIGYSYSVTPKFTLTPEIGSKMFQSRDGKSFFAKDMKYPELALYIDASF